MKTVWIILIVVIVAAGAWWYYQSMNLGLSPNSKTLPQNTPSSIPTKQASFTPKIIEVSMTSSGFSPKEININIGDTVKFINNDTRDWWPASGVHPTHLLCPGFDSLKGIKPGDSYSYTFIVAKACPMHDHLKGGMFGKITVNP